MLHSNKALIIYLLKFASVFCVLYFGTIIVIGLSTPENYYSSFVANYLDYVSLLRSSYLNTCKGLMSVLHYQTTITDNYTLYINHSNGIRLVYTCLAYGIMSFWAAFILANKGTVKRKIIWIFAGLLLVWCINVIRLLLVLIAMNKNWPMPLGFDHHTWFNIVAYGFIFLMIYFYDRSTSKHSKTKSGIS